MSFFSSNLAATIAFLALLMTQEPRSDSSLITHRSSLSDGCESCHAGIEPMHASPNVRLGCTDCHGGNATALTKDMAHVRPRFADIWKTSANPQRTYTRLLDESPEFIRFINPGDLRVAKETCGTCHATQTAAVPRSTMTTSAIFWSAVGYANGLIGQKPAFLGESYNRDGKPQVLLPAWPPTPEQKAKGALPQLVPLPRWEIFQPGEYFRAFERGGASNNTIPPEIGNPAPTEEAGRPDIRLGNRGRGTGSRISPGLINLHKTRLNDPHLSFLGTNEHPGDYRSSRLHGLSRRLRERSRAAALRPLGLGWPHRSLPERRQVHSEEREGPSRSGTSSPARCRPASACPATCTSPIPS